MAVPLFAPVRWHECPSCNFRQAVTDPTIQIPMHPCPMQGGLAVPLVRIFSPEGLAPGAVRHVPVVREDYAGREQGLITDDDGRVISAVRTERADGSNDCHAFAPVATIDLKGQ
jgi:hypothetical protein